MCDLSSVPPPNQQPVASGGLPASPPAEDALSKAGIAVADYLRGLPYWTTVADLFLSHGEEIARVALVAARDTDETTLRTHIAEELRTVLDKSTVEIPGEMDGHTVSVAMVPTANLHWLIVGRKPDAEGTGS